jgi:hypothetical protein
MKRAAKDATEYLLRDTLEFGEKVIARNKKKRIGNENRFVNHFHGTSLDKTLNMAKTTVERLLKTLEHYTESYFTLNFCYDRYSLTTVQNLHEIIIRFEWSAVVLANKGEKEAVLQCVAKKINEFKEMFLAVSGLDTLIFETSALYLTDTTDAKDTKGIIDAMDTMDPDHFSQNWILIANDQLNNMRWRVAGKLYIHLELDMFENSDQASQFRLGLLKERSPNIYSTLISVNGLGEIRWIDIWDTLNATSPKFTEIAGPFDDFKWDKETCFIDTLRPKRLPNPMKKCLFISHERKQRFQEIHKNQRDLKEFNHPMSDTIFRGAPPGRYCAYTCALVRGEGYIGLEHDVM